MSEADGWNAKKRFDDVILPADITRSLIGEIIWWHNQTGNPVTIEDIFSRNRAVYVMAARADCMRRLRETRGWSYPRIGKYFGMDHTTVLHHCNKQVVAQKSTETWAVRRARASRLRYERKRYAKWLDKPHALGGESSTTNGVSNGMG